MLKTLKIAAISALVAVGALASAPAAQADGIYFSIGQGHYRHAAPPHFRHHGPYVAARGCTPRHAVRKASRYGIHRAHVARVGRNVITVRGHRHHRPAGITFARAPGCPVVR